MLYLHGFLNKAGESVKFKEKASLLLNSGFKLATTGVSLLIRNSYFEKNSK
jgi:hypothetical protein